MFGKRKGRETAGQPSLGRSGTSQSDGVAGTVIVPRSATAPGVEPYELIQSVISFVNTMMEQGVYHRNELPAKTLQAYHADYYLAQVLNGGHSQFIHNSGANYDAIAADVRAGLAAMGAHAHHKIFEQMTAWVARNKAEAAAQTGFAGGRAAELDELDEKFSALDNATPMIPQSARWIAAWPELSIVDDSDYTTALGRLMLQNPRRDDRLMARAVQTLARQMTDPFYVGSGLACANTPDGELRLGIGGGSVMDVEGEKRLAFYVRTNVGTRYCVSTDERTAIYEEIPGSLPPDASFEEVNAAIRGGRYKGPTVGRKLAQAKRETIAGVIELADAYRAPAALDLVLRRVGIPTDGAIVAAKEIVPHRLGAMVNWIVLANGNPFRAQSTPDTCTLFHPGSDSPLMVVRQAEVAAHAAHVVAASL